MMILKIVFLTTMVCLPQQDIEVFQYGGFELTAEDIANGLEPREVPAFVDGHPCAFSEDIGDFTNDWKVYGNVPLQFGVSKWYNWEAMSFGSLDLIDTTPPQECFVASEGVAFVDLGGTPTPFWGNFARLNQNVPTEPGRKYIVTFDISSNQENGLVTEPREFFFFWAGNPIIFPGAAAPAQNTWDTFTFILLGHPTENWSRVGWGAVDTLCDHLPPPGDPIATNGIFGPLLDNVSAIEIRAVDDLTNIAKDQVPPSVSLNLLVNDSGVDIVEAATVIGCSSNLTLSQCGMVDQNGFPGGQVTWRPNSTLDSIAKGETAFVEIGYITRTTRNEGRNGENGPETANDTGIWRIEINGDNDNPIANNDCVDTVLNREVNIPVTDNDQDIDGNIEDLSIAIVSSPTSGSVLIEGLSILYTPNNGFSGEDVFQYRLIDKFSRISNPASVAIRVFLGDINGDGVVNLSDVAPFVALLNSSSYQEEADFNLDGAVNLLDVELFVAQLSIGPCIPK